MSNNAYATIGIMGKARSGKDTLADLLVHHGICDIKYTMSSPLKTMVCTLFGWGDEHKDGNLKDECVVVYVKELNIQGFTNILHSLTPFAHESKIAPVSELVKELLTHLNVKDGVIITSPREVYQIFGTDMIRGLVNTFWVDCVPGFQSVVISDIRFENEKLFVESQPHGIIIKLVNDRISSSLVRKHVSEDFSTSDDDDVVPDIIIHNDGTLDQLETQVIDAFGTNGATRLYPVPNLWWKIRRVLFNTK